MRGLKINEQSKKPKIGINPINGKVKISGEELSSFKKNVSRDIPLAPTSEPKFMDGLTVNPNTIYTGPAKTSPGVLKAQADKAKRNEVAKNYKKNNGGYSTGVQVSPKDEKAHPEDFKYLKNK